MAVCGEEAGFRVQYSSDQDILALPLTAAYLWVSDVSSVSLFLHLRKRRLNVLASQCG